MNFLQIRTFKIVTLLFFGAMILASSLGVFVLESQTNNFILENYLSKSIVITVVMGLGVMFLASLIAVFFAYYNVYFNYKYKRVIHIMVILPLCIPAYISAYNYAIMLSHGGNLQFLGLNIKNIYGAIFIYALCLYPYIYLILISTMRKIPYNLIEIGHMYHVRFFTIFRKIIFPLTVKSLIVGNVLVLAEVFSDIGVVTYFNIKSLALLLKEVYTLGDYSSALKLGYTFAFAVLLLFVLEQNIYKNMKFSNTKVKKIELIELNSSNKIIFYCVFVIVSCVAFTIPVVQMIFWAVKNIDKFKFTDFLRIFSNTTILVIISLLIIIVLSLIISHTMKYTQKMRFLAVYFNVGYIVPSIIISLIIFVVVAYLNNTFGLRLVVSSGIVALVCAYVVKYISLALNNVWKNYEMIHPNISSSSVILSGSKLKTFFKVDLPLCKKAVYSAMLIVIIDIYKELTLAMTLRPFNFETLATRVAMYAKDEMVQESSIHSLTIIAVCLICVLLLEKVGKKKW